MNGSEKMQKPEGMDIKYMIKMCYDNMASLIES